MIAVPYYHQDLERDPHFRATVMGCYAGRATLLLTKSGDQITHGLQHAAHLASLNVGDEVVALRLGLETIIVATLCAVTTPPAAQIYERDGCVHLHAKKRIRITTPKGKLEINPDGSVQLFGEHIVQTANKRVIVEGEEIHIL